MPSNTVCVDVQNTELTDKKCKKPVQVKHIQIQNWFHLHSPTHTCAYAYAYMCVYMHAHTLTHTMYRNSRATCGYSPQNHPQNNSTKTVSGDPFGSNRWQETKPWRVVI